MDAFESSGLVGTAVVGARCRCVATVGNSGGEDQVLNEIHGPADAAAPLLAATTHAEPLSEDGSRLEFYDDGYPKLPECLRRKQPS